MRKINWDENFRDGIKTLFCILKVGTKQIVEIYSLFLLVKLRIKVVSAFE